MKKAHLRIKVIIDTNIIFSALLNTKGSIGDIIFNSDSVFQFYSNSYMRFEIKKHWTKLKKISHLTDAQLEEAKHKLFTKIHFINEELIPAKIWLRSEEIARTFDIDDTDFIALAKYLKGSVWTGDKAFQKELNKSEFMKAYVTKELIAIRKEKTGE